MITLLYKGAPSVFHRKAFWGGAFFMQSEAGIMAEEFFFADERIDKLTEGTQDGGRVGQRKHFNGEKVK